MSEQDLVCPGCGTWKLRFKAAHIGIPRGFTMNSGPEHCRASLNCEECDWYTCLG